MPSYTERRVMRYTPAQLFDLVAAVERYPEFLPWVVSTRVLRREDSRMVVDMAVGLSVFHGHFLSEATLDRPRRIDIVSNSALFESYRQAWTFDPQDSGVLVTLQSRFEFRSRTLQLVAARLFEEVERSMVDAFLRRARRIYGRPPPGTAAGGKPPES